MDHQNPYATIDCQSITISGETLRPHMVGYKHSRKQDNIDCIRLRQCEEESMLSNCIKHSVGCIITDAQGRIISTGYNGTPEGHQNCCDKFSQMIGFFDKPVTTMVEKMAFDAAVNVHREWSLKHEIHAEVNAIMRADADKRKGGTLYVNLQPCENCAKMIAASGVARVVYGKSYHRGNDELSREIFEASNIEYIHKKHAIKLF